MDWQYILVLVLAIPVILFPAAFIWYLNTGGIISTIKEAKGRWVTRTKSKASAKTE